MEKGTGLKNRVPEGLPCGQFVYSAEGDQSILYADSNVVHLYGCQSFEEFIDYIGNSFHNMVHPDDLETAEHAINAQTLESGHRHDYLRYRIITKQGDIRYVEDFGHIVFDEKGHAYYYVFIADVKQEEYVNEYYNSFAEGQIDAMNWKVDHLTGLKNIVAFREELESCAGFPVTEMCTVVVFDIIGLQKVNRNSGRNEGDNRIRSLVQSVYSHMPKDSSAYRGYDAEIIVVCRNMAEKDVINQIKETVRSCHSRVFFGVASTLGAIINTGSSRKKGTVLQALEEAQYDLNVKKMLHEESARSQSLTSLVRALEEVDQDTEEHVMRTRSMGIALGKRLGLSDAQLTTLELLCLLHDIGKIAIPLEILNKPGKLTDAEWAALRSHADKGYEIALASKELKPIAEYIRYHHERWDGKGYPLKLSGEDIPVLSRIISIVDAYDAMVNDRCYRKALSVEYAMKEISDNAGKQFDPDMAGEFLELLLESPELAVGKKTGAGEVRVFRTSAEQKAEAVNTQPVIFCEYELDVEDRIIGADPTFEAITGYSQDDYLGKMSQFDLIPPGDLDDYLVQVGNQFSKSNTALLRHRIQRKDGTILSVICHGERQFDSATRSFKSTIQIYEVGDEKEKSVHRRQETERSIQGEDTAAREAYEKLQSTSIMYSHLAHALARGYTDLYYVNMDTDELIEFHTDDEKGVLTEARRSADFFEGCVRDARLYVYPEDQEKFIKAMNKDHLCAALDRFRVFEMIYRRKKEGRIFYVNMKVTRMEDDQRVIVIAVSDIDELMRQRQAEERIQEERIIYARLHALAGNCICIYVVDPETNQYREFHATDNYAECFAQEKEGSDFFEKVRKAGLIYNYPEDLNRFLSAFTRANVMAEIERSGIFTLGYRILMKGEPLHVQLKAAMVDEKEGPRLVVGLYDIDAQIRQEEEFSRRLEQAQVQANIDALTGVRNKHAFLEAEVKMDLQIKEHRQPPFAIVMFDVNDLKKVNDTFGHQAGDQYIRDASEIICNIFKHSPVFRVGGDEFVAISQGKDYAEIEKLIREVADHNAKASAAGGIVIACGMSKHQNDECVAVVFERADHNMYENKNVLKSSGKRKGTE
ncbi:MAG: diguanylate cyclase [Blautia sp.]|nr:diguanylate cyclase [Blautia sp.]